jgi:hypothetical protein
LGLGENVHWHQAHPSTNSAVFPGNMMNSILFNVLLDNSGAKCPEHYITALQDHLDFVLLNDIICLGETQICTIPLSSSVLAAQTSGMTLQS